MAKYASRAFGAPVLYSNDGVHFVTVGGAVYFVEAGSLTIDSAIGKRSTASFTLKTDTTVHFQQFQQVCIYDKNTTLIFSGYLNIPLKEQKPGFQSSLVHTLTCCDQHYLADKRRVTASYTNKTCGFIVQDILNNILAAEGVTVGMIYDGPTPSNTLYPSDTLYPGGNVGLIPQATFNYATVAQALDSLAAEASAAGIPYYWQIDAFKRLFFVPYTAIVNSAIIDGSTFDQVNNTPYVQRQNPAYRNTQYGVGGVAQTVTQNATRVGDGNTTTFVMDFDLASAPTVTVDGATKNVGIRGVDSGKDWYWQQGSPDISQDSSATKLTNANTFHATYVGQYPNVAIASNNAQIQAQAALDGTSGIVEDVDQDATITSAANGLSKVSQLLTRYGVSGTIFVGQTRDTGYAPGQLVTVNIPAHNLYSAQMLIEDVAVSDQRDGVNLWYTVTAVMGPYDVTWVDFFSKQLTQQQTPNSINVGVSQQVALLVDLVATVVPAATMTATVYACPVPSNTLYPSDLLYPC